MIIRFFGYNTFLIKSKEKKIAIDPGGLFFYYFKVTSLIPKTEWDSISHIFVTHGDPDHYLHADKVALASGAPLICNATMLKILMVNLYCSGHELKAWLSRLLFRMSVAFLKTKQLK